MIPNLLLFIIFSSIYINPIFCISILQQQQFLPLLTKDTKTNLVHSHNRMHYSNNQFMMMMTMTIIITVFAVIMHDGLSRRRIGEGPLRIRFHLLSEERKAVSLRVKKKKTPSQKNRMMMMIGSRINPHSISSHHSSQRRRCSKSSLNSIFITMMIFTMTTMTITIDSFPINVSKSCDTTSSQIRV